MQKLHLRSWDISMDTKKYKVIITPTAFRELDRIYTYISEELYAKNAAKDLMGKIESEIKNLSSNPKIYPKIEKIDELNRIYRRIVVKKYIVLYTLDEENNIVFVSHIYYGKRDYLN